MCEINKNIQEMLKEKKLSQKNLSSFIDVSTSTVNNWLKLGRSIPSEYIIPICEFFEISPERLLLGKSIHYSLTPKETEMLNLFNKVDEIAQARLIERAKVFAEEAEALREKNQPQSSTSCSDEDSADIDKMYVDLFDLPASAGTGVYMNSNSAEPIEIDDTPENRKANFAVRVSGDSMEPRFYDGDLVLVQSTPVIDPWDIGIFIYEGCGYIKKFDGKNLISINPQYKPIKITDWDSFYCKGRVLSVIPHK